MNEAFSRPMSDAEGQIGALPSPEEVNGNEVLIEVTPPQAGDYRLLLEPLDQGLTGEEGGPGVETGLVKRYTEEQIRKPFEDALGQIRSYHIAKWNRDFDENPEAEWEIFIGRKTPDDLKEEATEAQRLITELQLIINNADTESQGAIGGKMGLLSMGRSAGLGTEANRQLGDFIEKLTQQRELSTEARRATFIQLRELIELEANVKLEIAKGARTRWDQLSESTKSYVKQSYLNYWMMREKGTFERNAELQVLYTHGGRRGQPGWWHEGQERAIYGAILGWRVLKSKLKQLDARDPKNAETIADYKKQMGHYENIVKYGSSAITGRLEHQTQFEPAGTDQISLDAWGEMTQVIDRIRHNPNDNNSQVKRGFVYASTTQEKASWETMHRKQDLYFHYAVAKNVRKRLTRTEAVNNQPDQAVGKQEFFDKIVYVEKAKDAKKPEYRGKVVIVNPELAVKPIDRLKKDLEFYRAELASAEQAVVEAQEAIKNAMAEQAALADDITILNYEVDKIDELIGKAGPGGGRGGGGGQGNARGLSDIRTDLHSKIDSANAKIKRAVSVQQEKDKILKQYLTEPNQNVPPDQTELGKVDQLNAMIEDLEDRIEHWDDPTWRAAEDAVVAAEELKGRKTVARYHDDTQFASALAADKEKRYNELVDKLDRYLNDPMTKDDLKTFYRDGKGGYFNQDEVRIMVGLTGLGIHTNKVGINHLVVKHLVEKGTDDYKDDDFVFINLNAIGEQVDRLSPEILSIVMNPKNKGRFREVHDLMADIHKNQKEKIVIVMAYPLEDNVAGGVDQREAGYGGGRAFDHARAAELKETFRWNDNDLFMHWLDDLNIQRELGVRPEEIVARFTYWRCRHHQLRRDHLQAEDGWTVIHDTIPTGTTGFFESMIRRLFDGGYNLTSQSYRGSPYFADPLKTNERTTTIVDKNLNQKVIFRDQNLSENPETNAPETLVKHLYQTIVAELNLYSQRSQIGGQVTAEKAGVTDPAEIGAFIQANLDLIEAKRLAAKSIFYDLDLSAEARLDKLLAFRKTGMKNLTYELLDENGNININAGNRELWQYYNGVVQYYGKLNRDKREAEFNYAQTATNPHATPQMIEVAEATYIDKLQTWRNFGMKQSLLGLQATGQLKNMTAKEIGKLIAGRHAKETVQASMRMQEQLMRAHFFYDDQYSPPVINATRRLVGKLFKNRVADHARWLGHYFGVGDRFLSEMKLKDVTELTRKKFDDQIFRRLAAHMAYSIKTGYQNEWSGVFDPESSTILYPGSPGLAAMFGEDVGSTGVHLSPTGREFLKSLEYRVADDIGDAIDRTLRVNMNVFINGAKNSGWDIDQLMYTYQHARMNDSQRVVDAPWTSVAGTNPHINRMYDMYAVKKGDRTAISMVDAWLLKLLRERLHRPYYNLTPGSAPADTRYVPLRHSDPPIGEQYQQNLDATASV